MNKYNPQIHHRRSIRLKGYDYAQAGLYFITICCEGRIHRFGHIKNGEMILNEYGQIAFNEWVKTPQLRPNIELGEFIIMPNHFHGIIQIGMGELDSPNISPKNTPNNSPENRGICDTPERFSQNRGVCNTPLRPFANREICDMPERPGA